MIIKSRLTCFPWLCCSPAWRDLLGSLICRVCAVQLSQPSRCGLIQTSPVPVGPVLVPIAPAAGNEHLLTGARGGVH